MKKAVLFVGIFWINNCFAITSNVVVSTDVNTVRLIDLSKSITDTYTSISVGNEQGGERPTNGSATIAGALVTYTPNNGYIGFDSFKYSVFNAGVFIASATITINIGSARIEDSTANTPSEAVSDTLNIICFSQGGSPVSSSLLDLCSDFLNVNATTGELEAMLAALAPKEIDSQNYLSNTITTNQIDNIRKRLAALRQGSRGLDATRFSLNIRDQKNLNVASLFKQPTSGGGASSDQFKRSPWGSFFGGNVGGGEHDASENVDGYQFSTYGVNAGLDYRFNANGVIGAALGFNSSDMDIDQNQGDMSVTGGSVIAYGNYYISPSLYIESILARYQNDFESNRVIEYSVQGVANSVIANGQTNNGVLSFSLGLGYATYLQKGFTLTVSGSADYIKSTFDGFAETGAGDKNLLVSKREEDLIISTLDLQATHSNSFRSGVLISQLGIAWKHEFEDQPAQIEAVLFGDPTNTLISFSSDNPETDYFKANFGFSWLYPGGNTIFISVDTTLGQQDYTDYNLALGIRLEF